MVIALPVNVVFCTVIAPVVAVQPAGSKGAKVVSTTTGITGPLFRTRTSAEIMTATPAIALAGELTMTPTTCTSAPGGGVGVAVSVGAGSAVAVAVGVAVPVGVGDAVAVGVGDAVAVGVVVGVSLGASCLDNAGAAALLLLLLSMCGVLVRVRGPVLGVRVRASTLISQRAAGAHNGSGKQTCHENYKNRG